MWYGKVSEIALRLDVCNKSIRLCGLCEVICPNSNPLRSKYSSISHLKLDSGNEIDRLLISRCKKNMEIEIERL